LRGGRPVAPLCGFAQGEGQGRTTENVTHSNLVNIKRMAYPLAGINGPSHVPQG